MFEGVWVCFMLKCVYFSVCVCISCVSMLIERVHYTRLFYWSEVYRNSLESQSKSKNKNNQNKYSYSFLIDHPSDVTILATGSIRLHQPTSLSSFYKSHAINNLIHYFDSYSCRVNVGFSLWALKEVKIQC